MVFSMEQLDQVATHNILRAMSVAGIDREGLAAATGISGKILLKRMSDGSWKLPEIALIGRALGVRAADLFSEAAA